MATVNSVHHGPEVKIITNMVMSKGIFCYSQQE